MEQPLVIIQCLVYNHEPYLRQCLDGFVMQQTNFPFYAVVHDDASTDNSAAIIREYAEKYPDIIHPIYETENQYSKGDGSLGRIMNEACKDAKYIALCEGDDYWIDPLKLQKQVDFLEANEDYAICYCRTQVYYQDEDKFVLDTISDALPDSTTIIDLARGNFMHTPTVVYRRNTLVDESLARMREVMGPVPAGDYALHMFNAQYGNIMRLNDVMVVYRVHRGGIWSMQNGLQQDTKWLVQLYRMTPFFSDEVRTILRLQYDSIYNVLTLMLNSQQAACFQIRSSYAYRIGKIITTPFAWIKRHLKR